MIERIYIGRRKTSVARVILKQGNGTIVVNNKPLEAAFPQKLQQEEIKAPLTLIEVVGNYDVSVNVNGGGITGQAGAIRLGIARSLADMDIDIRKKLKDAGYLTRDPRMVERKKYGRPKARKRFQFSKR